MLKRLAPAVLLLLLTSCGMFGAIDYGPAVLTNKSQAVIYEELRGAFVKVIMSSPSATEARKAQALADIDANRVDFYGFNGSLEHFLTAAGEIDPKRILQLAKDSYDWVKARDKDNN